MGSEILFVTFIVAALVCQAWTNTLIHPVPVCSKGNDCGRYDCCVLEPSLGYGVCQPMRSISEECHTSQPYAWSRPEAMVTDFDRCPCETGSFCASIEGGELGICSLG